MGKYSIMLKSRSRRAVGSRGRRMA